MEDPSRQKAEQTAFRLLTLRAHSEKELRAKLRDRGFGEDIVDAVLGKCRRLGYLDDAKFARGRARELVVNRLLGDSRISLDLRDRGIPEELSRQAIAEARQEMGEEEAVETLLRRKGRAKVCPPLDEKERLRLARGLLGKGFPRGLVYRKLWKAKEEEVHDDAGE
ncbi:MAG: regulatory protein RecX [Syntrophales bacterium]